MLAFALSVNAYAGLKTLAIGGAIVYKAAPVLIRAGTPKALAKAKVMIGNYVVKNPEKTTAVVSFFTALAIENSSITDKTSDILLDLRLISEVLKTRIKEDSVEYAKSYSIVKENINDINEHELCKNGSSISNIAYSDMSRFMSTSSNPVKLFDVGSYKMLKRNSVSGDKLEHDHIPSSKAVISFVSRKLKNNDNFDSQSPTGINIFNNSSVIEISSEMHSSGRTYKGRNSKAQIAIDEKNLQLATLKDMSYHLMNYGVNKEILLSFRNLYSRNSMLCLYEK